MNSTSQASVYVQLTYVVLVLLVMGSYLLHPMQLWARDVQVTKQEVSTAGADTLALQTLQPPPEQTVWALYLPFITYQRCNRPDTTSVFGVQMYADTGITSPYYPSLLESRADWVRVAVEWRQIEPQNVTPDRFNWEHSDRALSAALDGCVNLIATHDRQPLWAATQSKGLVDRAPLSELQQYFGALVERYDGDGFADAPGSPVVNYWEMYNEPDSGALGSEGGWGRSGQEYANMLAALYPVIKSANPNAKVLFGGILMDFFEEDGGPFVRSFLDDVLEAGAGDYFDIMNFHAYAAEFSTRYPTPGLIEKTEDVRSKLQTYGLNKPIVVTESGWHSNSTAFHQSSPEIQARYVLALYAQAIAAELDTLIWWMLWDPGNWYQYDNGLVTHNSPVIQKPALLAYQTAVEMLGPLQFVRRLTLEETNDPKMEVYQYVDPSDNRTVYVVWLNPIRADNHQTVRLPATHATIYDLYGSILKHVADGEDGVTDGYISVKDVGSQPRYIVVNEMVMN